jgi:hypothetical protein
MVIGVQRRANLRAFGSLAAALFYTDIPAPSIAVPRSLPVKSSPFDGWGQLLAGWVELTPIWEVKSESSVSGLA